MLLYLVMAQASLLFFDRKPRAHEEEAGARIFIESETYDFGKLEYEGDGSHVFILKNTGNRELLIHRVQGSCSCAIVEWTEEPIMPGKTGQVKVTYHTKRVGRFAKYFTVRSNAINEPEKKLLIQGEVLPQTDLPQETNR